MTKTDWKAVAAQLKKPHGEYATQIGERMNESNRLMNLETISGLDLQKGNKVLEIGMGNGAFINNVFEKAHKMLITTLVRMKSWISSKQFSIFRKILKKWKS